MKPTSRRQFIHTAGKMTGLAIAAAYIPADLLAAAKASAMPLGFQTWTVKDKLGQDLPGTLKTMAGMGYQSLELCSPGGYAQIGFGWLAKMKNAEVKKIIEDAGLVCHSSHFGFAEFTDEQKLNEAIQFAQEIGLTQMILSTFWLPQKATLDDYRAAADKLNTAAEKIKAAGMQAGFHNHDFEFHKIDDQLIYDVLLERLDKDLVKLQFQTQVITLGYKAADYFRNYPGRFISSHLSDWTSEKKEVPVGQGIIDWNEFFVAAKTSGGVQNIFVEMAFPTFEASAKFLRQRQLV